MGMRAQAQAKHEVPCAACRLLHRRCNPDCILAPYFPPGEPEKFASVHRVFGASNIIKMLQNIEMESREDAVKSMIYEAHARIKDPVLGSTSAIFYLQLCAEDIKSQLRSITEQVNQCRQQINQLLDILMDDASQISINYDDSNSMNATIAYNK